MENRLCDTCKYGDIHFFGEPCCRCNVREDGSFSEWASGPMPPEDFKNAMEELATSTRLDKEDCHKKMDRLMCEVLRSLGYDEGIDIFDSTAKWYA